MNNVTRPSRSLFLALLILITPTARADDLLDRLEAATEKLGENQGAFYVARVPELKDKLPAWEWDQEIRDASKCVLDGIQSAKGRSVAEAYVLGIEKEAKLEITSIAQLSDQNFIPSELRGNDQTLLNLLQSCGTLEISTVRLKQSGIWDEMMKPAVMDRLLAE